MSARFLDEVARQYRTSGSSLRKLLLAEIQGPFSGDPAIGDMFALLQYEAIEGMTQLRRHARWTLGELLPAYITALHGLGDEVSGRVPAELIEACAPAAARMADHFLAGSPRARLLAGLAAGFWPAGPLIGRFWRAFEERGSSFAGVAALVEAGDPQTAGSLIEVITEHGPSRPDLLLLLTRLPAATAIECALLLWPRLDTYGRSQAVWALGAHPLTAPLRELVRKWLVNEHPFVVAHLLISAVRWRDAALAEDIAVAAERHEHNLVRRCALRALAATPGVAAAQACVRWLERGDEPLCIEALDALAAHPGEVFELGETVAPLLESMSLQVRVAAAALATPGERLGRALAGGVASRSAGVRRRALGVLISHRPEDAVGVLAKVLDQDDSRRVRRWAMMALARAGGEAAFESVLGAIADEQSEVWDTAALALPRVSGVPASAALARLDAAVAESGAIGPRLFTPLGLLALAEPGAGLPPALARGLESGDSGITAAALRAARPIATRVDAVLLKRLAGHPEVHVRRRAAVLQALAGDAVTLMELIPDTDAAPEAIEQALRAVVETGALLAGSATLRARLEEELDRRSGARASKPVSPPSLTGRTYDHEDTARLLVRNIQIEVAPLADEFETQRNLVFKPGDPELASGDDDARNRIGLPPGLLSDEIPRVGRRRPQVSQKGTAVPLALLRKLVPAARPLIGAAAALTLVVAIVASASLRAPGPVAGEGAVVAGPPDLPAGVFAVDRLEGYASASTASGQVSPLRTRGRLEPGEVLETDGTGRVSLVDRAGNRIRLGPTSKLRLSAERLASRPDFAVYSIAEPEGDALLDFRAAGDTLVMFVGRDLQLARAVAHVHGSARDRTVLIRSGDATFFDAAGGMHRVRAGHRLALDAAGKGLVTRERTGP